MTNVSHTDEKNTAVSILDVSCYKYRANERSETLKLLYRHGWKQVFIATGTFFYFFFSHLRPSPTEQGDMYRQRKLIQTEMHPSCKSCQP